MAIPTKIEWDCGRDAHGRAVKLIYEKGYSGGKDGFTVKRAEMDQRDESESVSLLTSENILAMADAVKGMGHG